jgi:hypothetical protein
MFIAQAFCWSVDSALVALSFIDVFFLLVNCKYPCHKSWEKERKSALSKIVV